MQILRVVYPERSEWAQNDRVGHAERSEWAQNDRGCTITPMKDYYVYIVASRSRTLYTGVTSNLGRRVAQHKMKLLPGFTARYRIERLVYFEHHGDIHAAIQREKQIKGWIREKKLALIKSMNPGWCDLSDGWIRGAPGNCASRVARASETAGGGGQRTDADSSRSLP